MGGELGGQLEGADPQVACGHPRQHRARLPGAVARHLLTGGADRQGAGGRNAEGVHRQAHQVFPQHRPEDCLAVAAAGERGPPGSLQVQVFPATGGVDDLTEQQRPAVAEQWRIATELVPGVRLRNGRYLRRDVADEQPRALGGTQGGRVDAELGGQGFVEHHQARFGKGGGAAGDGQFGHRCGVPLGEGERADGDAGRRRSEIDLGHGVLLVCVVRA